MDFDAHFPVVVRFGVLQRVGGDEPVAEFDAGEDGFAVFFLEVAVEVDLVDFLLVVGRVREALGHLAVVGEQQDAGRVLIEPAYGEYPYRRLADQLHDRLLGVGIAGRGHIAARLVHHDVHLLLAFETLTVETDFVGVDVDLAAQFRHDLAVDGHYARENEAVGFAAGADARIGDVLVQAHHILYGRGDHVVVGHVLQRGLELLLAAADHGRDAVLFLLEILLGRRFGAKGLALAVGFVLAGGAPAFTVRFVFAERLALTGGFVLAIRLSLAEGLAVTGASALAVRLAVAFAPARPVSVPVLPVGAAVVIGAVRRVNLLRTRI